MKAGSYVICVDDSNWSEHALADFNRLPILGHTYRVRRIIPHIQVENGPDGVALEGIFGQWKLYQTFDKNVVFEERHFRMNRFREIEPPIDDQLSLTNILEEELLLADSSP